ncbi:MAG: energy transducer TonB [Pyrinomonadaceae bacterium]
MRKIFFICFLLLAFCPFVIAQSQKKPFAVLDDYIKKKESGWEDSRIKLSKLFQQERTKLKSGFETELWKYLGESERKHYWVALFLDSDAYLHGYSPMPELALNIRLKGVKLEPTKLSGLTAQLNPEKPDVRAIVRKLSMLLTAAVSAEGLDKTDLAVSLQKEFESLLSNNQDLESYLPILSKYKRCLYEKIRSQQNLCQKDSSAETNEGVIAKAAIINSKAISIPKPDFPKATSRQNYKGVIRVGLVIDEQGNVISAKAFEGPMELYDAAEKAALQAKFTPTFFFGRPWKVTSEISFNLR